MNIVIAVVAGALCGYFGAILVSFIINRKYEEVIVVDLYYPEHYIMV